MPRTGIPRTMRAVEIREPGAPRVLRGVERPVPHPLAGEVLIRVLAAGVNRPDVLQRKGLYPPPPGTTDIPGLEVAGEVVLPGSGVREPPEGARVRSEEHTSELQSLAYLVCRLLLAKKTSSRHDD